MNWYKQAKEKQKFIVREESPHDLDMESAYAFSGCYLGSPEDAEDIIDKYDLDPDKIEDHGGDGCGHSCSIGFCSKEEKWYGWSHRAVYGFGIGSTCEKGDSHYSEKKGKWKAETLDDAKQMAIDFAESVS